MTHPPDHDAPVVETFELGPFQTNCYLVRPDPDATACWIVDCGFEPDALLRAVEDRDLQAEACVLTHAHCDHIAGLHELRRRLGPVPIWIHHAERAWLEDPMLNLSAAMGLRVTAPPPDHVLEHDGPLRVCGQDWRVLHTPGHSPGGITIVHDASRTALVGDTLFNGSIGRHDFPNSDFSTLEHSIKTKLYTLPDETRVYPGHGPATTIGHEKATNPFVRA